ncbi:MAG: FAD:protein FMN transferase [Actinomycetota bacterium]|nr:FAD:protein FMN transferase [Actinomycetota bacterium]
MNFSIWGLSGSLHTEHENALPFAEDRLHYWLDVIDQACNRFRADSELSLLNGALGEVTLSDGLTRALVAARRASDLTEGLCDPTVLTSLEALGYDRDYDTIGQIDDTPVDLQPAPGFAALGFDEAARSVQKSPGWRIDLGASAKALVADLVADDVAPVGGVLVEIGGDVSARGRGPQGPWVVGVASTLTFTGREPRITLENGAVATSSNDVRTWRRGETVVGHIIDPRTGRSAVSPFAAVSVIDADCVGANAFATAALLWGEDAAWHIAQAGRSARLVRHDGGVEFVGAWPREEEA